MIKQNWVSIIMAISLAGFGCSKSATQNDHVTDNQNEKKGAIAFARASSKCLTSHTNEQGIIINYHYLNEDEIIRVGRSYIIGYAVAFTKHSIIDVEPVRYAEY